ncbi:MAG TPA: hypothetical protein VHT72_03650, partial [Puia sp.]|nr:hypothetical protein [Puia sp.]
VQETFTNDLIQRSDAQIVNKPSDLYLWLAGQAFILLKGENRCAKDNLVHSQGEFKRRGKKWLIAAKSEIK